MTHAQRRFMDYVAGYTADHGYCPSYSEIQRAMGWRSKAAVTRMVQALELRGHLRRSGLRRWRGLQIVYDPQPLPLDPQRLVPSLLSVFEQIDAMKKHEPTD